MWSNVKVDLFFLFPFSKLHKLSLISSKPFKGYSFIQVIYIKCIV